MVGVLILTDKAKERGGKDIYDGKKNFGVNKIIAQMDDDHEYCSPRTMDNYEHVIFSITSYYDILNLAKAVSPDKKCKLHVGGPGVNNIRSLVPIIDTAWFGRSDSREINGILAGQEFEALWRKEKDPNFEGPYCVKATSRAGLGYEGEVETSVGCRQKCKFCHYSFWNKYVCDNEESYKSGYTHYEDFFQAVDWSRGRVITALDGMTEKTRKLVAKPLPYQLIKEKLLESNSIPVREKNLTAKIYSIIGFPWEEEDEIDKCDITRALKELDGQLKQPILFYFHLSHFVPMQKTPLWNVRFNFANYWKKARETPLLYGTDTIKLYTGTSTTSPASAAVETFIQRADNGDFKSLKIFASKKWGRLSTTERVRFLKQNFMAKFVEQEHEKIANIKTPYKYSASSDG